MKFQTASFTKNILTSGMGSVYFFFVPNRLLWDDWTSFIAQEDGFSGTFPTTSTLGVAFFDRATGAGNFSSLYRRAYKLCYNQFFGLEGFSAGVADTWYADITTDTEVNLYDLKNTEQFSGRFMMDAQLDVPTYSTSPIRS